MFRNASIAVMFLSLLATPLLAEEVIKMRSLKYPPGKVYVAAKNAFKVMKGQIIETDASKMKIRARIAGGPRSQLYERYVADYAVFIANADPKNQGYTEVILRVGHADSDPAPQTGSKLPVPFGISFNNRREKFAKDFLELLEKELKP